MAEHEGFKPNELAHVDEKEVSLSDLVAPGGQRDEASKVGTKVVELELSSRSGHIGPPLRLMDQMLIQRMNLGLDTEFLHKQDIVSVHLDPKGFQHECGSTNIRYGRTEQGQHVLQQVGFFGGSAACVEMIRMDHELTLDSCHLNFSRFGGSDQRSHLLEQAGLDIFHFVKSGERGSERNLEYLEEQVGNRGSAIISIYPKGLGIHAIIVDELCSSLDIAKIREPFRGGALSVRASALERCLQGPLDILQVAA